MKRGQSASTGRREIEASGINSWSPRVFDDDADTDRRFEQIREFALTLRENLFETSRELQQLKTIAVDTDTKKPQPAVANHSDASPGKTAGQSMERATSAPSTFEVPRPTKLT